MGNNTRSRKVRWKEDPAMRKAVEYLEELLGSDSPFTFRFKSEPGMGVITNRLPLGRNVSVINSDCRRLQAYAHDIAATKSTDACESDGE